MVYLGLPIYLLIAWWFSMANCECHNQMLLLGDWWDFGSWMMPKQRLVFDFFPTFFGKRPDHFFRLPPPLGISEPPNMPVWWLHLLPDDTPYRAIEHGDGKPPFFNGDVSSTLTNQLYHRSVLDILFVSEGKNTYYCKAVPILAFLSWTDWIFKPVSFWAAVYRWVGKPLKSLTIISLMNSMPRNGCYEPHSSN